MRNWFAGRNIDQWTMTAWVNRVKDSNYDLTGAFYVYQVMYTLFILLSFNINIT